MKQKCYSPRLLAFVGTLILTIVTLGHGDALAQFPSQLTTGTCTHKISLSNLSPLVKVSMVKVSCLGSSKIMLAKAPTGFSTSSQYPAWVVWSASNQDFMPQGAPISGEFELLMEPLYNEVHSLEVEWIAPHGTICKKVLKIYCSRRSISSSKPAKNEKGMGEPVKVVDGILEFKDQAALLGFYKSMLSASPAGRPMPKSVLDSIANSLQNQFPGFRPLYRAKKSDEWRAEPILAVLLNDQQAIMVNGALFAFDGPFRMHTIPPSVDQKSKFKQLVEGNYQTPDSLHFQALNVKAKPSAKAKADTLVQAQMVGNACEQLFISKSD